MLKNAAVLVQPALSPSKRIDASRRVILEPPVDADVGVLVVAVAAGVAAPALRRAGLRPNEALRDGVLDPRVTALDSGAGARLLATITAFAKGPR